LPLATARRGGENRFAMIIFGSGARERKVGEGRFFCPNCKHQAPYQHLKIKEYFALYFVPLIPIGERAEFVQCGECGGRFKPAVLNITEEEAEELSNPWLCPACNNKNPPEHDSCVGCGAPRS
jgi:transcription elongation factor Elf1